MLEGSESGRPSGQWFAEDSTVSPLACRTWRPSGRTPQFDWGRPSGHSLTLDGEGPAGLVGFAEDHALSRRSADRRRDHARVAGHRPLGQPFEDQGYRQDGRPSVRLEDRRRGDVERSLEDLASPRPPRLDLRNSSRLEEVGVVIASPRITTSTAGLAAQLDEVLPFVVGIRAIPSAFEERAERRRHHPRRSAGPSCSRRPGRSCDRAWLACSGPRSPPRDEAT